MSGWVIVVFLYMLTSDTNGVKRLKSPDMAILYPNQQTLLDLRDTQKSKRF